MKSQHRQRYFTKIGGLAILPVLAGVAAFAGPAIISGALGVIGATVVVLFGVAQWKQWQKLLAECEAVAAGHAPSNTNDANGEFADVFTTFETLESRRRKTLEAYQRTLDETRQRIGQLAEGTQAPKALTAPKLEGLAVTHVDTAFAELHKAITLVRQRMAGMTRLMSILPEPLIILDEAEKIRYMNTAAEQLVGRKMADCMKQPFSSFLGHTGIGDPLGRNVITPDSAHQWLAKGNQDEVVADVVNIQGYATRVGFALSRPTATERERLFCLAARPLTKQYGQVNGLVRSTRGEAVQAVWHTVDGTLHPSAESLQTQVRLLTAEVKQSSLRNTLMGRVQSLQQISNRVDLFLRINHWLGLCLQGQLPEPVPTELASPDLARVVSERLNPIVKASKTTITVQNNGGGWLYADEEWLQMALFGVLWHAGQAAPGGMIELHTGQREPGPANPEGSIVYSISAPGTTLTAESLGQWEQAFDGIPLPTWLNPETPGYLPGVQLARYLVAQLGGTLEFEASPSRSIAMHMVLPARSASTATPNSNERYDGPALEELCMGWTLGGA